MTRIILFPNANIMHQERIISIEFLSDNQHVKLKTEVLFPETFKSDIRNYPEYPIRNLCLRIE